MAQAIFGGGCFWCTEAVFAQLRGVTQVESGYAGGTRPNPTYEQVCTGVSGHAEVIRITHDPNVIDYPTLLAVFFATHDPTTPNRQGNDIGSQYRSVIFYLDETQRAQAAAMIAQLQAEGVKVVTEMQPAPVFYPAEAYHQNFYARNPNQGYCNAVIPPKLAKLQQKFAAHLKG